MHEGREGGKEPSNSDDVLKEEEQGPSKEQLSQAVGSADPSLWAVELLSCLRATEPLAEWYVADGTL